MGLNKMDLIAIGLFAILLLIVCDGIFLAFDKYMCEDLLLPDDHIKWNIDTGCMVKNKSGNWEDIETYRNKIKTGDEDGK